MADKKNNKNIIVGACVAAIVVIAIILAVVFAAGGGAGISDSYFVSDGSKYVITTEFGEVDPSDQTTPAKVHEVYTYAGDKITSLKIYNEYSDETAAKNAYEIISTDTNEAFKSVSLNGKYIIFEANESEYESITTSDLKQQIEFIENAKNANVEEYENSEEEIIVEESEEVAPVEEEVVEEEVVEE